MYLTFAKEQLQGQDQKYKVAMDRTHQHRSICEGLKNNFQWSFNNEP